MMIIDFCFILILQGEAMLVLLNGSGFAKRQRHLGK